MNVITHILESKRLVLVWQAPEGLNRTRRVVGELLRKNDNTMFRYLVDTDDYKEAIALGFTGFPSFKLSKIEHCEGVIDSFMRRLPPRSRTDFHKFMDRLKLPVNAHISDFALLGYSEAKLPGDGFSILDDYRDLEGPFEILSEVAGARHYVKRPLEKEKLIGKQVLLEPEPDNKHDPNAIRVLVDNEMIGYINRIQAPTFLQWIANGQVEVVIDAINGTSERPQINLFVRVKAKLKRLT